ncbi:protein LAZY 1 [Rosa sericea]
MKLLQWVHQKFQHSSIEPLKDLSIGNPCICLSAQPSDDDQDAYTKPTIRYRYGSTFLKPPRKDQKKSFSESEDRREEETSVIVSELFHGFLTIGTLGSETSANEPATPTFATPLENLTEKKTEVTENDLKLINYELERFLEAETREDPSSARGSHVSSITISGMQMEDSEDEEYCAATMVCPLQGYLLGSSVELPEMRTEAKKEKASLQELFDRTKVTEKFERSEEKDPKQKRKSAMGSMKNIIKKLYASSKSSTSTSGHPNDPVSIMKKLGEASDSVSTKKKPHKVLRMFQRRIHPEGSIAEKEFIKSKKYKDKSNSSNIGGCNRNLILMGAENRRLPHESKFKEGTKQCKKYMDWPQYRLNGSDLRRNEEHWIKTDADYLVLEL